MNKKYGFIFISLLIIAAAYLFYFAQPRALPENNELLQKINSTLLNTGAVKVQDTIFVDDRHVFVPFITKNNEYGKSFWIWDKYKWNVTSIQTGGQPSIWKINKEDPTSYRVVWNIHPDDNLKSMKLYLARDRNYHITGDIDIYQPGVLLEKEISLETLYGSSILPHDWVSFMNSVLKLELDKPYVNNFELEQTMYFGWNNGKKYDENDYPRLTQNGSGSQNEDLFYVRYFDDHDLGEAQ
ncbi:hypothetical protein ACFW35_12925 [Fictibacillus sp. NPDC058756]|uniref:hypothetical protein n=1 Tax=Fictibacillus sp. NPDC058756 TaxID=3346625 RepID=UPI0036C0E209